MLAIQGCSKKVITANYPGMQTQADGYYPPKYYEAERTGSLDNDACSNQLKKRVSEVSYSIPLSPKIAELEQKKQELTKTQSDSKSREPKTFSFDNAEVVGYLDNPSPVYQSEDKLLEGPEARKSQDVDAQIEQLKLEMEQAHPEAQKAVKPKRMITYDGSISCRSNKPDSCITGAIELTESLKGYVEQRNEQSVTLRIPVNSFGTVYDSLLKLGEIIDYQRTAEDITDAFRDTDLRVTVLEKTIERYVKLIKLVKEEKDKIALLKEIERLRVELEMLKVQKSVLSLRAEYGKLVYSVQQISTGFAGIQQSDQVEGFEWLSYLDPFNTYRFGKTLKLTVPDGMVSIKDRDLWIAQSPAGSKIWTTIVPNSPSGTSDFWINAVAFKLNQQYLFVDTSSVSEFRFLRCTPQPGANYRYYIGVKVVGEKIHLIQCYFPDELQENRYFTNIKKVLTNNGGAS
jgi:hypothetical protein